MGGGSKATAIAVLFNLPLDGLVTLNVYALDGTLIKTLLNNNSQSTGLRMVSWDGRDTAGNLVADSGYYVVIDYTVGGFTSTFDTRSHTGGADISGNITGVTISQTLAPLSGQYINIGYTLPENAQVTLEITDVNGNLVRTISTNQVQTGGSHSVLWDGADNNGFIVAPGTAFNVRINAISLSTNSLITEGNAPQLSSINAAPLRFSPAINPYGNLNNSNVNVQFSLNKTADVTFIVSDSNGIAIRTVSAASLLTGPNSISWDGRNGSGVKMAAGNYTLKLQAQDTAGGLSNIFNIQTEIFY